MAKTTKKQFNMFRREIKNLLKLYGLMDWEVIYCHEQIDGRAIATTAPELESRIVVFTLNMRYISDDPPMSDIELKAIALHEVLELLFTKLEDMVCKSNITAAREEVHAIIQTLINVGVK